MSDSFRKPLGDKISEGLTPESQKSGFEKAKESVTDNLDKAANNLTPDSNKSGTQTLQDKLSNAGDQAHQKAKAADERAQANHNTAQADLHSAKADLHSAAGDKTLGETVHEYVEAGKEQLENAAQYVQETISNLTEGQNTGAAGTAGTTGTTGTTGATTGTTGTTKP
ncbi:hypothetical protein DICA1_D19812 [Diutina catenulata]